MQYSWRVIILVLAHRNVSYLKYDNCGEVNLNSYAKFSVMRDAINATGHSMVLRLVRWLCV